MFRRYILLFLLSVYNDFSLFLVREFPSLDKIHRRLVAFSLRNIRTFTTGRQFVNGIAAFTASLIRLYNDRKAAWRRVHSYDSAFTSTGTFTVYYCRYRESRVLPIPSSILLCVSHVLSSFYPIFPYRSKTTDSEFLISQNFLFFHSIFPDRRYNIFRTQISTCYIYFVPFPSFFF